MANNKNSNAKQPSEKAEGKFHYNPGNMSGKKAGEEVSEKKTTGTTYKAATSCPRGS